eukprot:CAMPEP_0181222532 /NCGR_PEP_ID=MMETSP1096-20121128/30017_1 /TAXON_ID=156174 ORGANISM="Chrysochromulina ericina, Strain CCMP281" /NCGR_SAMPLE_ID=MMETSP1096 /ASSEMBLY_ACC=CAM_ASM_000453 /LENGTH=181 /DNA_ID=CAMNT_0023315301 /DNA_START=690 /DNA_END=1235 /DNA_ORIENTATION=+
MPTSVIIHPYCHHHYWTLIIRSPHPDPALFSSQRPLIPALDVIGWDVTLHRCGIAGSHLRDGIRAAPPSGPIPRRIPPPPSAGTGPQAAGTQGLPPSDPVAKPSRGCLACRRGYCRCRPKPSAGFPSAGFPSAGFPSAGFVGASPSHAAHSRPSPEEGDERKRCTRHPELQRTLTVVTAAR